MINHLLFNLKNQIFPQGISKRFIQLFTFPCLILLTFVTDSIGADIYLQLRRGEKVVIALPEFVHKGFSKRKKSAANKLHRIAKNDLLYSRLFNLIEEGPSVKGGKIDFAGWGKNGADILVTSRVDVKKDKGQDKVQMIASVFEIPSGKPVFQKKYQIKTRSMEKIAHELIADILYRFTGNRGISATKLTFINNNSGYKELYVIDYDGENLEKLTAHKNISILPRWSPDGQSILYTNYSRGNPDLYSYSLKTNKSKEISYRQGLNTSASYSPDGNTMVVTLSYQGSPSLYLLNKDGGIIRRLTKNRSAQTSASFSADGRKIIFVSDRPGWPQIYMMDADGSNLKRMTHKGYCDSPVWSPLGDKIAYSRGTSDGDHDIILMDLSTEESVQLTHGDEKNENPSFSPDGRFIVFSSNRSGRYELYITSLDGLVQKKIPNIPSSSFTPSWGP